MHRELGLYSRLDEPGRTFKTGTPFWRVGFEREKKGGCFGVGSQLSKGAGAAICLAPMEFVSWGELVWLSAGERR